MRTKRSDGSVTEGLLRILFHLREVAPAQPGETRTRILEAAIPMFAGRGYAGTSMRDIAAGVNIKAASLYAHFPNGKEQLLQEGLRDIFDEFLAHIVAPLNPEMSPEEQLRAVVHQHVNWQLGFAAKALAWDAALDQFGIEGILTTDYETGLRAQQSLYHGYVERLVRTIRPDESAGYRALAILTLCNTARIFHESGGGTLQTSEEVGDVVWTLTLDLTRR